MFATVIENLKNNRESFVSLNTRNKSDIIEYINKQIDLLPELIKAICTEVLNAEDNTIPKIELKQNEEFSDTLSPEYILSEELKSLKIEEEYFAYDMIMALPKIIKEYPVNDLKNSYDEIIANIAKEFNKQPRQIKTTLTFIRKKADYANSKYLPILAKMGKDNVNNYFLLHQFVELCM